MTKLVTSHLMIIAYLCDKFRHYDYRTYASVEMYERSFFNVCHNRSFLFYKYIGIKSRLQLKTRKNAQISLKFFKY